MKCSMSWLREWINPSLSNAELCDKLTMGGLEVESLEQDGDDFVLDLSITPNRGDCLSIRGLAREVAALTGTQTTQPSPLVGEGGRRPGEGCLPVTLEAPASCPRYIGRIIRGVNANTITPTHISERLRKAGVRVISPIVDITNYVMLELGQPMHAFDLATIESEIKVRKAKQGEKINLLDGSEKNLDHETLIIADKTKPLAIAGVMGGLDSSVTHATRDILLESAWFTPQAVARQRQHYHLNSESASRFERGVDYTIQREAIERATQLVLEVVGGQAEQLVEAVAEEHLPKSITINFTPSLVNEMLGVEVPSSIVEKILCGIEANSEKKMNAMNESIPVTVPSYRFDLTLPEDLVEEVARLHGYDQIPTYSLRAELKTNAIDQTAVMMDKLRQRLIGEGFHEIISYSFVDKKLQQLLDPDITPRELVNPITTDMEVMRTNLWPGLVNVLLYNKSRQQHRVRIFESGLSFITQPNEKIKQVQCLAGLISGLSLPEQWGAAKREVDFYDLKGCVERALATSLNLAEVTWQPENHPALHPGQAAGVYYQGRKIGLLGCLSPVVLQSIDIKDKSKALVFELELASLLSPEAVSIADISKFPEIRRDIALMLNATIPALAIQDTIRSVAGDWLKGIFIFDVYQGKGISPGLKSVALGLILQHPTRTLIDDEVNEVMDRVTTALKGQLGAELRS